MMGDRSVGDEARLAEDLDLQLAHARWLVAAVALIDAVQAATGNGRPVAARLVALVRADRDAVTAAAAALMRGGDLVGDLRESVGEPGPGDATPFYEFPLVNDLALLQRRVIRSALAVLDLGGDGVLLLSAHARRSERHAAALDRRAAMVDG